MSEEETEIRRNILVIKYENKKKLNQKDEECVSHSDRAAMLPIKKSDCNLTTNRQNMIYAFNRLIWQGNQAKIFDILENSQKFSAQYNLNYTAQQLCTTPDRWGRTCLHQAALTLEDTQVITEAFITYGAEVDASDKGGNRPLHFLANPACIKVLLNYGADIHAKNNDGKTTLDSRSTYNAKRSEQAESDPNFYRRVEQSKNFIRASN